METDDYEGKLIDINIALEYNVWKHLGVGIGYNTVRIDISADGDDLLGDNLSGGVEFDYGGLQLYGKIYFWRVVQRVNSVFDVIKRLTMKNERHLMRRIFLLLSLSLFVLAIGCSHRLQHPTKPRSEWANDHAECEKEARGYIRSSPDAYGVVDEMNMIKGCMKRKGWHR
jgi:hypothetical protein